MCLQNPLKKHLDLTSVILFTQILMINFDRKKNLTILFLFSEILTRMIFFHNSTTFLILPIML